MMVQLVEWTASVMRQYTATVQCRACRSRTCRYVLLKISISAKLAGLFGFKRLNCRRRIPSICPITASPLNVLASLVKQTSLAPFYSTLTLHETRSTEKPVVLKARPASIEIDARLALTAKISDASSALAKSHGGRVFTWLIRLC